MSAFAPVLGSRVLMQRLGIATWTIFFSRASSVAQCSPSSLAMISLANGSKFRLSNEGDAQALASSITRQVAVQGPEVPSASTHLKMSWALLFQLHKVGGAHGWGRY